MQDMIIVPAGRNIGGQMIFIVRGFGAK